MSIPAWLAVIAIISIVTGFACAVVIVVDLRAHPQPMAIMNVVWPITALYLGPVAVWWYWTLARAEGPRHYHPMLPFWKTIIIEATHCGAGCTLGDVVAEFGIFGTGLMIAGSPLLTDYLGDFCLAYVFGIVFQYFAIAPMRGLSFWPGLWAAIQADTLSVIAFEIGLFAWMWVMTQLPFHADLNPFVPTYWFLMQIGMTIGFATSYPANWLLVRKGVKVAM